MKLGFVGLGAMGKPMATHLLQSDPTLAVFDMAADRLASMAALGAKVCATPQETGASSEVVFTMVTTTHDVEQVLFGEHGVARGLKRGGVVIDMSSISPTAAKQFALRLREQGVEMLDAPVSGGPSGAINATLSIMAGGRAEVFNRVLPLLQRLGKTIVHIGDNGAGQVTKCSNQIALDVAIQGVAEALFFAQRNGVDPAKVREVLLGGLAASRALEVCGKKMVERDFGAGMEARLHHKDIGVVMDIAWHEHLPMPATAATMQQLNALMANGWSRDDPASLLRVLEQAAQSK
jgi:2-hydroxy-3-oxopropionate reductase